MGVLIIDDTFNSSPPSAVAALGLLADLEGRKVAVLGDMLELGAYERDGTSRLDCVLRRSSRSWSWSAHAHR